MLATCPTSICMWNATGQFLLIDTNDESSDSVVVSAEPKSGTSDFYVTVKLNDDPAQRVNVGGGSELLTKDLFGLEIKTDDGDDTIDVSSVKSSNGYNPGELNGNIELKGQRDGDEIIGSPFDDILEGREGNDDMSGGLGNDVYNFDADHPLGDDVITENSGGGTDSLDYVDAAFAISVDLNVTSSTNFQSVGTNHRLRFPNAEIENVYASNPHPTTGATYDDTLKGNAHVNILEGRGGDDTIEGRGGNDRLEGGGGDDTLKGGDGDDIVNGGPGEDDIEGNEDDDVLQGDGFGDRVDDIGVLDSRSEDEDEKLDEASGLVVGRASWSSDPILWTIEDAGNPTHLYANDADNGVHRCIYNVENSQYSATNVDWEDLAFYKDGSTNYLYIADIGDNDNSRSEVVIYRVEEPSVPSGECSTVTDVSFEVIKLQYPEWTSGMRGRDAETFMIDPLSGDFYIVTKWEPSDDLAHLYHLSKPASGDWETNPADAATKQLVDKGPTRIRAKTRNESPSGGDISPGGKEVVIKSDNVIHVFRYDSVNNTSAISLDSLLTESQNKSLQIVNARDKENREAIAYTPDGNSLYTISEADAEGDEREVNRYDRVTNLVASSNLDSTYGGDSSQTSVGDDRYIAVECGSNSEVADWQSGDVDTVVGLIADMDFDGDQDFDDINDLVLALTNPNSYFATYGLGGYVHGDTDGDGDVDFDDISGFNAELGDGDACN